MEGRDQGRILAAYRAHLDVHAIVQRHPFTQLLRIRHDRETGRFAEIQREVHCHGFLAVEQQRIDFQPSYVRQIRCQL